MLNQSSRAYVHLDGDDLREVFSDIVAFDLEQRLILARRYSRLCKLLSCQGVDVICSTISLFSEIHMWNRENLRKYVEIYLAVDLDTLKKRDPKGLYRRAEAGEIDNVMGVDLPVEEPETPDLVIRNDGDTDPGSIARMILEAAMRRTREGWTPTMGISK
jgi:adenylylsulfate kinase